MRPLRTLLLVPFATLLPAQGFVVRDGVQLHNHLVAYDSARQRLVASGRQGDLSEFDATQWLRRPGPGPLLQGTFCYRSAARRLCGLGHDRTTWEYDGVSWQQHQAVLLPLDRWAQASAYDSWRDRVVLFGGSSFTTTLADTWEWNGTSWLQRAVPGPPARLKAAMAFDSARGVTVLFGGVASGTPAMNDTWEWDGTTWRRATPATVPPGRSEAAMAYDPVRARTVLYGGFGQSLLGDVWEYDGTSWQQVAYTGGPAPRYQHDMVFDSGIGETLAIAGLGASSLLFDVWQWNGTRWRLRTSAHAAPRGYAVSAASEPISGGVLMHGNGLSNETWLFRAGTWTLMPSQFAPYPRSDSAMWCDGANAFLFGGRNTLGGFAYSDTWRWTATGWQTLSLPVQPSPRTSVRAAWDGMRGRAVLFGGFDTNVLRDTWTFDGTAWQQQAPLVSPPARCMNGIAFDPPSGRVVMFGGTAAASSRLNDTWEWDGTNWRAVTTLTRPPAHGAPAMHWDGSRILMTHAPSSGSLQGLGMEAWRYDGIDWTPVPLHEPRITAFVHALAQVPGTVSLLLMDGYGVLEYVPQPPLALRRGTDCGASSPQLAGREQPRPGNAEFGLDVVSAPPSSLVALGGSDTPASLPLGPCTLLLAPPLTIWFAPANAAGFATQRITLPAQPRLIGSQWFFQAAVLQPALPAGFTLSAALRVVVGA